MRILVPFDPLDPKSRLSPILSASKRHSLATVMLRDVVSVIQKTEHEPRILSTTSIDDPPAPVVVDERDLSTAVNAHLDPPMGIVMADLALLTPETLRRSINQNGDVVIAPGRGGGTNVIIVRDDRFHVDFHDGSLQKHRRIAEESGLTVSEIGLLRSFVDVDEPEDLLEVYLHGEGETRSWLSEAGFELTPDSGGVTLRRSQEHTSTIDPRFNPIE